MSTNKTPNLNLHSWVGTDYVKRTEFNENFAAIDTAVSNKADKVAGKQLSTEDFTTAEKTKLAGIETGAEVNDPSFKTIAVLGQSSIVADVDADTLTIAAGSNVTITTNATTDTLTIAATDTTYGLATTADSGLMSSTDKAKVDGIATGAEVNQNTFANIKVGTTTIAADAKQDTLELVAGTNITLTPDATNDKVTIATSGQPNQNTFANVKVGTTTIAADAVQDTLELVAGTNITLTPDATNDKVTIAASSPVDSVNGKTGAVSLSAGDVGAVPTTGGTMTGRLTVPSLRHGSGYFDIDSYNAATHGAGRLKTYYNPTNNAFYIAPANQETDAVEDKNVDMYMRYGATYQKLWHGGNDGAGSGLDADTVDGVQGYALQKSIILDNNLSMDPNTTLDNFILSDHLNTPKVTGYSGYWYISTHFFASNTQDSSRYQVAVPYFNIAPTMFVRYFYNGVWSAWKDVGGVGGVGLPSQNLDSAISVGTYRFSPLDANNPFADYGIIVVKVSDGISYNGVSNWIWQIAYCANDYRMAIRRRTDGGVWTAWKEIGGGGVKSVQRGSAYIGGNYIDVLVSAVDTTKAMVNLIGTGTQDASVSNTFTFNGKLLNSTTLRVSASSGGTYISWELVEFS